MPQRIDPGGYFDGQRMRNCSDTARLLWPPLYLAANGLGRLELDFENLIYKHFRGFKNPPTEEQLIATFEEYRVFHLAFLYESAARSWCQFWVKDGFLPNHVLKRDKESPEPPVKEYQRWLVSYPPKNKTLRQFFENAAKDFEKFKKISHGLGWVGLGSSGLDCGEKDSLPQPVEGDSCFLCGRGRRPPDDPLYEPCIEVEDKWAHQQCWEKVDDGTGAEGGGALASTASPDGGSQAASSVISQTRKAVVATRQDSPDSRAEGSPSGSPTDTSPLSEPLPYDAGATDGSQAEAGPQLICWLCREAMPDGGFPASDFGGEPENEVHHECGVREKNRQEADHISARRDGAPIPDSHELGQPSRGKSVVADAEAPSAETAPLSGAEDEDDTPYFARLPTTREYLDEVRGRTDSCDPAPTPLDSSEGPTEDPPFADWYATYTRKVGKSDAKKAWGKLSVAKRQRLVATWPQWRTEFEGRASDYVPYPASFIRELAWEEPPPPAKGGARSAAAELEGL